MDYQTLNTFWLYYSTLAQVLGAFIVTFGIFAVYGLQKIKSEVKFMQDDIVIEYEKKFGVLLHSVTYEEKISEVKMNLNNHREEFLKQKQKVNSEQGDDKDAQKFIKQPQNKFYNEELEKNDRFNESLQLLDQQIRHMKIVESETLTLLISFITTLILSLVCLLFCRELPEAWNIEFMFILVFSTTYLFYRTCYFIKQALLPPKKKRL